MKLLYILPHCSTGGMPQYALKQIQSYKDEFDIKVIEAAFYGEAFKVQRDQIEALVPFYSIYDDQTKLLPLIEGLEPDLIHFQEVPESFITEDKLKLLYSPDRPWFNIVTTHSSLTTRRDFRHIPDQVVTVNRWQKSLFEQQMPETSIDMWEYPIESKLVTPEQKNRARFNIIGEPELKGSSGSSGKYSENWAWMTGGKNVLNVGLFTAGKNQAELFEVAAENPQNMYHFVGNQAPNFADYWRPLMEDKPINCIVWGERANTDNFYKACDEFYFTSKFELNPIVIKEALSYGLPTKLYKLPTYLDDYDNNPLVTYL